MNNKKEGGTDLTLSLITFRDLSSELTELDRLIPVRSDENTIFTCFLEYELETVKVHDIVYNRNQGKWNPR